MIAKMVEKVPVIDHEKRKSEGVEDVDPLNINTVIKQPPVTNTVTEEKTSANHKPVINDLPVKEDVPLPEHSFLKQPQVFSIAIEFSSRYRLEVLRS
jgi:hypothetical protein